MSVGRLRTLDDNYTGLSQDAGLGASDDEVLANMNMYYADPNSVSVTSDSISMKSSLQWKPIIGYILFLLLGIAPQLLQNGIFLETPIFRERTPEGSAISAYIITAYMTANIVVVIYLILQSTNRVRDEIVVWLIFVTCLGLCILIGFLWEKTITIHGHSFSIAILIISFFAGAAGNTSTLVFFAFASQYQPIFTSALYAGYSTSSVLAALLALAQILTDDHSLSIILFFMVLLVIICLGILSYYILTHHRIGKSLRLITYDQHHFTDEVDESYLHLINGTEDMPEIKTPKKKLFYKSANSFLNMIWISMLTFLIPGMIAYMTKDKRRMEVLNNIFLVAPPIGAAIAGFLKFYKVTIVNIIATLLSIYICLPVLKVTHHIIPDDSGDHWVLFIIITLFSLLSGYNTTMIYLLVRQEKDPHNAEKLSRWVAMANQVGATMGSGFIDILIASSQLVYA